MSDEHFSEPLLNVADQLPEQLEGMNTDLVGPSGTDDISGAIN